MKRSMSALCRRALPWLLALPSAQAAWAAPAAKPRFSYQGLPPALAGQTLEQAERALGSAFEPVAAPAQDGCQPRSLAATPGVVYVIDAGVLSRVETRDPRYATISGVRVGDDVGKARRVYGRRLDVGAHLYFAKGLTLSVASPDGRFALVMESNDDRRIITIRSGAVPAVQRLEGCSR